MKNVYALALTIVCILVIINSGGCSTIEGLGKDLQSSASFIEHKLNFGWKQNDPYMDRN